MELETFKLFWRYCDSYDFPAISLVCKGWYSHLEDNISSYTKPFCRMWVCCLEGSNFQSLRSWHGESLPALTLVNGVLQGATNKGYLPKNHIVYEESIRVVNGIRFLGYRHSQEHTAELTYALIEGDSPHKIWLKPILRKRADDYCFYSAEGISFTFEPMKVTSLQMYRPWYWQFKKSDILLSGMLYDRGRKMTLINRSSNYRPEDFEYFIKVWCKAGYRPDCYALIRAIQYNRIDLVHWILDNGYHSHIEDCWNDNPILERFLDGLVKGGEFDFIKKIYRKLQRWRGRDTVLEVAGSTGNLDLVKFIYKHAKERWFVFL